MGFTGTAVPRVWGGPRASRTGPCPGCGADPGLHGAAVPQDPGGGARDRGSNQAKNVKKWRNYPPKSPKPRFGAQVLAHMPKIALHTRTHAGVPGCRRPFTENTKQTPCHAPPPRGDHTTAVPDPHAPKGAPRASRPARSPTPRADPGLHPAAAVPRPGLRGESRVMSDPPLPGVTGPGTSEGRDGRGSALVHD